MPLLPPGCPNSILYLVQFSRVLYTPDYMLWLVLQSLWHLDIPTLSLFLFILYFGDKIFCISEFLYCQGGSWTSDLLILLPPPSRCWDYSRVSLHPVHAVLGVESGAMHINLLCKHSSTNLHPQFPDAFIWALMEPWCFFWVCIWIFSCGLVGDCWLTLSALN